MSNPNKFFQNETKFVIGKTYETVRVTTPPYNSRSYVFNLETCDEVGTIDPGSELLLGTYVRSFNYGHGDNRGRCDFFINDKGVEVSFYLDYDGKTRYREVKTLMDERLPFLNVIESTQSKVNEGMVNEHINKFILNEDTAKEICSFMNPLIQS
jgi:hypothetical protein